MGKLFLSVLVLFSLSIDKSWARASAEVEGFFEVEPGISLYARVTPGDPNNIIVELNGLTQDTDHWQTSIPYLKNKGATIINIDLALQGRSMQKRLKEKFTMFNPVLPPLIMRGGLWDLEPTFPAVPIANQSRYVSKLLKMLGVTKPVTLLGLSYGGGLALQMAADYPDQIKAAILAAPYAFPLPEQDETIRTLVNTTRTFFPQWRSVPYDDLYDLFLRGLVVSTYHLAEPEVLKWSPPFQAIGASELVRGIRHLKYTELFRNLRVPLHLVIAGKDSYIPRDKLDEFWAQVPSNMKGSSLEVQGSEHKMNEAVGPFLASWAWEVATNPDYLRHPGQFMGIPQDGVATEIGGSRVVKLQPAAMPTADCQQWLIDSTAWKEQLKKIQLNPLGEVTPIMTKGNPLPNQL